MLMKRRTIEAAPLTIQLHEAPHDKRKKIVVKNHLALHAYAGPLYSS